ncbi:hypothetical protein GOP47_0000948 [Adiantum capillus-veneris]|uniref:Uncharacterized protein n=1 Tax=Adiantum capillus-veneris TaxID=13818 RepID=A0A9D4VE90_ADICA|nr:hypothetical protein GOP47_0000948 [Adiantum capillus-veneris]
MDPARCTEMGSSQAHIMEDTQTSSSFRKRLLQLALHWRDAFLRLFIKNLQDDDQEEGKYIDLHDDDDDEVEEEEEEDALLLLRWKKFFLRLFTGTDREEDEGKGEEEENKDGGADTPAKAAAKKVSYNQDGTPWTPIPLAMYRPTPYKERPREELMQREIMKAKTRVAIDRARRKYDKKDMRERCSPIPEEDEEEDDDPKATEAAADVQKACLG